MSIVCIRAGYLEGVDVWLELLELLRVSPHNLVSNELDESVLELDDSFLDVLFSSQVHCHWVLGRLLAAEDPLLHICHLQSPVDHCLVYRHEDLKKVVLKFFFLLTVTLLNGNFSEVIKGPSIHSLVVLQMSQNVLSRE